MKSKTSRWQPSFKTVSLFILLLSFTFIFNLNTTVSKQFCGSVKRLFLVCTSFLTAPFHQPWQELMVLMNRSTTKFKLFKLNTKTSSHIIIKGRERESPKTTADNANSCTDNNNCISDDTYSSFVSVIKKEKQKFVTYTKQFIDTKSHNSFPISERIRKDGFIAVLNQYVNDIMSKYLPTCEYYLSKFRHFRIENTPGRKTWYAKSNENMKHPTTSFYQKRIGKACDPKLNSVQKNGGDDDGASQQKENGNVGDESGSDDESENEIRNEPFPGMVLQTFQHSSSYGETEITSLPLDVTTSTGEEKNELAEDNTKIELRSSGAIASSTPSLTHVSMFRDYHIPCQLTYSLNSDVRNRESSSLSDVNEYQLLGILQPSLGLIDRHNQDYAYRPVVKLLGSTTNSRNAWILNDGGSEFDYARMGQRAFAGGSHGEVWKARRRCNQVEQYGKDTHQHQRQNHSHQSKSISCDDKEELILKRMKIGEDAAMMEAGLREVYFGDILRRSDESSSLFTKYIDHFFLHHSYSSLSTELWIVFHNAGPSLRSYIYTPVTSGDFVVYQHSPLWRQMRMENASLAETSKSKSSVAIVSDYSTSNPTRVTILEPDDKTTPNNLKKTLDWKPNGEEKRNINKGVVLKDILYQILRSAAKLHERGIVHRDIKPSNIMCNRKSESDNSDFGIKCVLGDFSSAWDDFSSENIYSKGPTAAEQTNEYAPPEVLFGKNWTPFFKPKPESYDSWSIGVVILELLLGTPNVFSVDQRTTTLLTNKMNKEDASEEDIQRALYLAALSQFCIYIPTNKSDKNWPLREGDPLFKASIVKTTCTIHDFHSALRARDPLGIGFDKSMDPLLQLIWGLLAWDPKNRLTAAEAMEHFYFTNGEYDSDEEKNALEPQMLDPRLDTDIENRKIDSFVCPKCGRKFNDLQSCQAHTTSRRHSKFCSYDRSLLPPCLNAHSMLPSHPTSGYCDIQGRRRVIEDFHTVHLEKDHQFFGIFDGHSGNLASKYAASELYKQFVKRLKGVDDNIKTADVEWKKEVVEEMKQSFEELHNGVLDVIKSYPTGAVMSKSGTTATALFVTEYAVIVASVGDSRAVLSVGTSYNSTKQASSIQLTFDHVASDKNERKRIENLGATISSRGGVLRVNGTLVLSRSIGDAHLAKYLSRVPNVVTMTKKEVKEQCRLSLSKAEEFSNEMPCFIILASDGLWDVLSNQEAVDLVEQVIQKYDSVNRKSWEEHGGAFQDAAEVLTQEAYVRGSTDNIGVCVVAIT